MDEMDGIFTNTTTATEDYFKKSITANVTIPIAVLKELMGMKREEPEKATIPETKYEGIPETIQWFRPQDKMPTFGAKCLCIFETDSGLMCACAVAGHASDKSDSGEQTLYNGKTMLYWAHIPKGPKEG